MFSTQNILFLFNSIIGIVLVITVAVIKGVLIFVKIQHILRNVISHFKDNFQHKNMLNIRQY